MRAKRSIDVLLRTSEASFHEQDYSIEETLLGLIVTRVREDVRKPIRDQDGAETERKRRSQYEAVAPGERHGRDDTYARDGDRAEEQGRQATEDGARDCDERGGEFGEDAHEEEEEAAGVTGFTVRATCEGDNAVILRKGRHGRYSAEAGDETVETVGEDAALHPRIEEFAFDFYARHVACGGDVADYFHHEDDVHS